jgi:hypothetical protein
MSNPSKPGRHADRRADDRRVVQAAFAGDDRREGERRSGEDRRQAPRVRL